MIINWKNVQKSLLLLFLFSVLSFSITSCDKDDDKDKDKPVLVEDGTYIVGDAFEYDKLNIKGAMDIGVNEANEQKTRDGMYEKYVALSANGGFNIVVKEGKNEKTYGPDVVADEDLTGVGDAPQVTIKKGTFKETTDKFTVPADGMYKVVLDNQTGVVVIIPIKNWGVIGGATGGWGADQVMALSSAFSKTALTYEVKDVIVIPGEYKFRHDGGWKVSLTEDGSVKTNTNFGGSSLEDLKPGGTNLKIEEGASGYYTITMAWTLDNGFKAKFEKTGDYTPAAYPEAMYVVGDATAYGWDTPGSVENAVMHKCAGEDAIGVFWKICYIEGGKGFKVSDKDWGSFNYGFAQITEFDADGLAVSDSGGNMGIENSGMYIVVLDLRDNQVKLSVKAAEVYGIGDAFGGWNEDAAENLFTLNEAEKTFSSPALTADGNIRMYAQHNWIPAWWQAEFRVVDGVIDYRNDGDDQEAVAGTAGQVVTLKFDDNTGSVE